MGLCPEPWLPNILDHMVPTHATQVKCAIGHKRPRNAVGSQDVVHVLSIDSDKLRHAANGSKRKKGNGSGIHPAKPSGSFEQAITREQPDIWPSLCAIGKIHSHQNKFRKHGLGRWWCRFLADAGEHVSPWQVARPAAPALPSNVVCALGTRKSGLAEATPRVCVCCCGGEASGVCVLWQATLLDQPSVSDDIPKRSPPTVSRCARTAPRARPECGPRVRAPFWSSLGKHSSDP